MESPPEVLAYAPATPPNRLRLGLALGAYALTQTGLYSVLLVIELAHAHLRVSPLYFVTEIPVLVAVHCMGFAPSLLLVRPRRRRRRWLPYMAMAVIGAVNVFDGFFVVWVLNHFVISFGPSRTSVLSFAIAGFVATSFCVSLVLLLMYRAVFDRTRTQ